MPEYLYPGVYVEECDADVTSIEGVAVTDPDALRSIANGIRHALGNHLPEWTNFDDSDPGITLLQLSAWLAGTVARSGEIPERGLPLIRQAATALSTLAESSAAQSEPVRRPNFFSGRFLDAETLAAEQNYLRTRLRRHNQFLHGIGIVHGLGVRLEHASHHQRCRIVVDSGVAIDPRGNEIVLPRAAEVALRKQGEEAFVTVRYWERPCAAREPESADGRDGCPPCVEEACVIAIAREIAPAAVALARLVRSGRHWSVDAQFEPPRAR